MTLEQHLKDRGVNLVNTNVVINEKDGLAYFFLYNLSGQITGYQRYNPTGTVGNNKNSDKELWKYYTFVGDEGDRKYPQIYGLETYQPRSPYLFITEGIFDIVKIHNMGLPGIAILGNAPSPQVEAWVNTLPQKTIVICDNDGACEKLRCLGDEIITVLPPYKDLGDMPQEEANIMVTDILRTLNS